MLKRIPSWLIPHRTVIKQAYKAKSWPQLRQQIQDLLAIPATTDPGSPHKKLDIAECQLLVSKWTGLTFDQFNLLAGKRY